MLMMNIVKAIIVRAALLLHLTMTIWRVTVDLKDDQYWLMFCATIPFFIESLYTIIKRKGADFLLFTPCFFFYLITTIPCVWLLELRKTDVYLSGKEDLLFNKTENEDVPLEGLALDINPNTWTILIEELLLYLLIIGRWLLPRGEVTREQLSELLFAFIGIASDIMEMFSLFGEDQVRRNRTLSYCILAVWSVSVSQFCMTLTVTHKPRKGKNIKMIDDNVSPEKQKATISNEIIAILLSMAMQDVPFVSVRLYTIITYDLITYSLVFFTSKNCLVICLLIYKIAVLLQKRYCPENAHEEMDDDKELYAIGDSEDSGSDNNGKGKKSKNNKNKNNTSLDLNDTGSASTGDSKEKEKLEKFYEETESTSGSNIRERKPKKSDSSSGVQNGGGGGKDVPDSASAVSKMDRSPVKGSPKVQPPSSNSNSSLADKTKTSPQKSPNEKTPLNSPSKSPLNEQTPQSSSTPNMAKRAPTGSNNAPASTSTSKSRPRSSPTKTPQNPPPTVKSPAKTSPTKSPQHHPQPPRQQPPRQSSQDAPIASGFGWITSKPKEGDDVIVAGLS